MSNFSSPERRSVAISAAPIALMSLVAAALLAFSAGAASAQELERPQGIGLKVTGGLQLPTGTDFGDEGLDLRGGFGAETVVSHAWAGGLELGLGVGIGFHDPRGLGADASGELVTVFGEGLYRFRAAMLHTPHLHPFVGARAGWARLSLEAETNASDPSAGGFLAGGLAGVELWLSNEVGLVASAGFDYLGFGDLDAPGVPGADSPAGGRFGLQGGLKVRF